jgi:hypothetical protein
MTDTLEQMATLLVIYRVLKGRGRPVEEIGELLYRMGKPTPGWPPPFKDRNLAAKNDQGIHKDI